MQGIAKVQVQVDKKRKLERFLIYIPRRLVERLNIKKGNVVEFNMENPEPEFIEDPRHNWNKNPKFPGSPKPEQTEDYS